MQGSRADARVAAMLARHSGTLMRVARQCSLCHDDAADALQRALEIYVRRLDSVDPATEVAWLKVVVRHEAYAIRRSRGDTVSDPDLDLDAAIAAPGRSVEDQVVSGDRVSRSAEALRALKPDEARALMLKAHGLSYDEIARHCGWTYTKVNRCITEGRKRFMDVYAELEGGDACARFAPALRALASGVASSEQLVELRPHLRRCTACRATVRDLHLARLHRASLLLPLPALARVLVWLHSRRAPADLPDLEDVVETTGGHMPRMREEATRLLHRTANTDVATAVQLATSGGGGRIATLGAIVGLCVSSLGAGTVCLVTGAIDDPLSLFRHGSAPVVAHHHARGPGPSSVSSPALSVELASVRATPTPTPVSRTRVRRVVPPRPRHRAPSADQDPSQGRGPRSHESSPISPAPRQITTEFDAATASSRSLAAAAPTNGGGEFTP